MNLLLFVLLPDQSRFTSATSFVSLLLLWVSSPLPSDWLWCPSSRVSPSTCLSLEDGLPLTVHRGPRGGLLPETFLHHPWFPFSPRQGEPSCTFLSPLHLLSSLNLPFTLLALPSPCGGAPSRHLFSLLTLFHLLSRMYSLPKTAAVTRPSTGHHQPLGSRFHPWPVSGTFVLSGPFSSSPCPQNNRPHVVTSSSCSFPAFTAPVAPPSDPVTYTCLSRLSFQPHRCVLFTTLPYFSPGQPSLTTFACRF